MTDERLWLEALSAELTDADLEHLRRAGYSPGSFQHLFDVAGHIVYRHADGWDVCWDCWRIGQKLGFIDSNLKL